MESVLEQFAQKYALGRIEQDDVIEQRILPLDGAQPAESGDRLLLCPSRYPEQSWEGCRRQMKQAGFEPQVLDDDSEERTGDTEPQLRANLPQAEKGNARDKQER